MKTHILYVVQRIVFEAQDHVDVEDAVKNMNHSDATFNTADAVIIDKDVESYKLHLHPKITVEDNTEKVVIA
tara:strand:+ start:32067 stop:32282 length:216 start_codon:yes stop_codon:yes gene_type:complete